MNTNIANYKKYNNKELKEMLNNSYSHIDCLRKMGYSQNCGSVILRFKEFLLKNNILNYSFLKRTRYLASFEQSFCENSSISRNAIKKRIMKNKLLPNICAICDRKPRWNNKPLILILDHINGVFNDHRLSNLRLVCPNCNSQEDTFAGKNRIYKKNQNLIDTEKERRNDTYLQNKEKLIKELPNCRTLKELKNETGLSYSIINDIRKKENINIIFFFTVQHFRKEIISDLKAEVSYSKIASLCRTTQQVIMQIKLEENIVRKKDRSNNKKYDDIYSRTTKYDDEEMKEIIIWLLIKYRTMRGVSKIIGISDNGVKKRCKKLNIDYNHYINLFHLKDEIIEFLKTNSMEKTTKKFRTSHKKIHKILKKEGIEFNPSNKPYKINKKQVSNVLKNIEAGKSLKTISKEFKIPYGLVKKINRNKLS